ncbi:MAG: hypothetical protein AAF675_03450 [Pseudomonadota bacterium]
MQAGLALPGITGYGETEAPPLLDRTLQAEVAAGAISALGGPWWRMKALEWIYPGEVFTRYIVPGGGFFLLMHDHCPLVALVPDTWDAAEPRFPDLEDETPMDGLPKPFRYLPGTLLRAAPEPAFIEALPACEAAQLRARTPASLGEAIFNIWD